MSLMNLSITRVVDLSFRRLTTDTAGGTVDLYLAFSSPTHAGLLSPSIPLSHSFNR
jgi:hypothetical protein